MKSLLRAFAIGYLTLGILAVAYGWYGEIVLRNVQTEHLLPGVLLAFLGLPMSLTLNRFSNTLLFIPHFQVAWLTVCVVLQSVFLFLVSRRTRPQSSGDSA